MTERWDVTTRDGGAIAVWVEGNGPPWLLVHGGTTTHAHFDPLISELRSEFTVFAMDRRGYGASPDGPGHSAEREFSDVATVVDAASIRTGEPVVLFGHSWGANYALGAARDLPSLRALVVYEPSLGQRSPPGSIDRVEKLLAAGDYEGVLIEVLTSGGMTEDDIAQRQAAPNWPERVATAPTIIREARIASDWDWQSGRLADIAVPTLLLTGSETDAEDAEVTSLTAAAIPGAVVHVFAGHGHLAHRSDPGLVADVLRDWLS